MEIKNIANAGNAVMKQRRSIRRYDSTVKISREELSNILKDALTAPSSINLQPWRFVVIDSAEGKELISPFMAYNQNQLHTSSAIIAIFGDMESMTYAEEILTAMVDHNLMTPENKESRLAKIHSFAKSYTREELKDVVLLDCGLVSMQLMLAAKNYGYDTNAIGGYMKRELTEALGLDLNRYLPIMLLSIGKAAEEGHNTVRFSVDEVTQWV